LPERNIIVIGASAGGLPALQELVRNLPHNLNASIFIVMHLSPWYKSHLSEILSRSGPLPARQPASGEPIQPGRIYVAPPNLHLLVENSHVEVWPGPKENMHRPAINPLFRSAAVHHGPRVIGVVLSGMRDDGAAGLWWIKRRGGVAVVQDPSTAQYSDMPLSAMEHVNVDYVVNLEEMPGLLARLAAGKEKPPATQAASDQPVWSPSKQN
jgi:two-component system chemotaxis response regulator CheB